MTCPARRPVVTCPTCGAKHRRRWEATCTKCDTDVTRGEFERYLETLKRRDQQMSSCITGTMPVQCW